MTHAIALPTTIARGRLYWTGKMLPHGEPELTLQQTEAGTWDDGDVAKAEAERVGLLGRGYKLVEVQEHREDWGE